MGLDGHGRNCLFNCCRGTQHFRTGGCGDYCWSKMHNVDYRRISPLLGLNFPFCPTQKNNTSHGDGGDDLLLSVSSGHGSVHGDAHQEDTICHISWSLCPTGLLEGAGRERLQLGGVRMALNPLDLMLISCTLWFGLRHLGHQRQDAVGPPGAKCKAAPPKWGRKQQNGDAGDLSWGWAHSEGGVLLWIYQGSEAAACSRGNGLVMLPAAMQVRGPSGGCSVPGGWNPTLGGTGPVLHPKM